MTYVRTNLYPINHSGHLLNDKYIKFIPCDNVLVNKFAGLEVLGNRMQGQREGTGLREQGKTNTLEH
jgi:hypothetical protein